MLALASPADLRDVSEHSLSVAVCAYAEQEGWLVHYERQSGHMGQDGKWRGSGPKGRPDLTLAKAGRILLAELKTEKGRLSPEQEAWLAALGEYGRLWRPRDAKAIMEGLP